MSPQIISQDCITKTDAYCIKQITMTLLWTQNMMGAVLSFIKVWQTHEKFECPICCSPVSYNISWDLFQTINVQRFYTYFPNDSNWIEE